MAEDGEIDLDQIFERMEQRGVFEGILQPEITKQELEAEFKRKAEWKKGVVEQIPISFQKGSHPELFKAEPVEGDIASCPEGSSQSNEYACGDEPDSVPKAFEKGLSGQLFTCCVKLASLQKSVLTTSKEV